MSTLHAPYCGCKDCLLNEKIQADIDDERREYHRDEEYAEARSIQKNEEAKE